MEASRPSFRFSRAQSIGLVFAGTLLSATAQVLIKTGATALPANAGVIDMITNLHLLVAYSLYGLFMMILTLALRDSELSIMYPVISLTFVWVTLLSAIFLRETITVNKLLGVAIIMLGVAVLGRGDKR